jgi:DNA-binding IclR family transcriptional regulator
MNQNTIPNLAKACEVLRQLAAHDNGLKRAEIEEQVLLPRATAFRILTTLCQEGFARKEGSRYFLGQALSQMGFRALSSLNIRDLARPLLADLAERSGETSHLAIRSGNHSLILEVCDSPNPIRVASRPGSLADMYCSSTGKVFLASMEDAEASALLAKTPLHPRTARTQTHAAALMEDLRTIRENGYAIDDEEYFDEVRCLAAPVRDAAQRVIASIGITGTASRFTVADNEKMAAMVCDAAGSMARRLADA